MELILLAKVFSLFCFYFVDVQAQDAFQWSSINGKYYATVENYEELSLNFGIISSTGITQGQLTCNHSTGGEKNSIITCYSSGICSLRSRVSCLTGRTRFRIQTDFENHNALTIYVAGMNIRYRPKLSIPDFGLHDNYVLMLKRLLEVEDTVNAVLNPFAYKRVLACIRTSMNDNGKSRFDDYFKLKPWIANEDLSDIRLFCPGNICDRYQCEKYGLQFKFDYAPYPLDAPILNETPELEVSLSQLNRAEFKLYKEFTGEYDSFSTRSGRIINEVYYMRMRYNIYEKRIFQNGYENLEAILFPHHNPHRFFVIFKIGHINNAINVWNNFQTFVQENFSFLDEEKSETIDIVIPMFRNVLFNTDGLKDALNSYGKDMFSNTSYGFDDQEVLNSFQQTYMEIYPYFYVYLKEKLNGTSSQTFKLNKGFIIGIVNKNYGDYEHIAYVDTPHGNP